VCNLSHSFLAMIEHCEVGRTDAQNLIACIERADANRPTLVRTLMFMGFKAATAIKHPGLVPKNNKLMFMIYRICKSTDK